MPKIKIKCKGFTALPYQTLEPFQGNLKDLSEINYNKLKKEILELGYSEPVSVWQNDGKYFLINGHQRLRVITRMIEKEGFECEPLPVSIVEADSFKEARKKVLALTSQYGNMTKQGLYEFACETGLDAQEIKESFSFPEINLDLWELEFFKSPNFEPGTVEEQGKLDEKKLVIMQCPHCGENFEKGQAKVID